jgi:hypothetical protein
MQRKARLVIWATPDDCIPPHGLDMESSRDVSKVAMLVNAFKENGFDLNMPALIGCPLDGKIQLLSGTHRHLAAKQVGIRLPVSLWLRSDIECLWGTEEWAKVLEDIPVKDLLKFEVKDGFRLHKYEKVSIDYVKDKE